MNCSKTTNQSRLEHSFNDLWKCQSGIFHTSIRCPPPLPKKKKSDGRPLFEELITTFDIGDSHLLGILTLMTIIVRKVIQLS